MPMCDKRKRTFSCLLLMLIRDYFLAFNFKKLRYQNKCTAIKVSQRNAITDVCYYNNIIMYTYFFFLLLRCWLISRFSYTRWWKKIFNLTPDVFITHNCRLLFFLILLLLFCVSEKNKLLTAFAFAFIPHLFRLPFLISLI